MVDGGAGEGECDDVIKILQVMKCTTYKMFTTVLQVIWDRHDPFYLFAGTDAGSLCCLDVRSATPLFTQDAHTAALTALAQSPSVPGCLVTTSSDHSVKVWDVRGHSCPYLVRRRMCKIGEVHCVAACPDEPLLFAVGGKFEMKLLNFSNDETITKKFDTTNRDLNDETVGSPSHSDSKDADLSPRVNNAVKKSRKGKITAIDADLSNPNPVDKSLKSDSADCKVRKKSKKTKTDRRQDDLTVKKLVKKRKKTNT